MTSPPMYMFHKWILPQREKGMTGETTTSSLEEWPKACESATIHSSTLRHSRCSTDPESGLTYAALIGKRKQSLKDAERLLSYHVSESLRRKGHIQEADHVKIIANWHEASGCRSLSQLKCSHYNYQILNYVLDDWMLWHHDNCDFSTIDINR